MLKNAPITPYIPAADVARARRFYEGSWDWCAKTAWFKDSEGNIQAPLVERLEPNGAWWQRLRPAPESHRA